MRLPRQQQVTADLASVSLLSMGADVDHAVEHGARLVVQHALEQLLAAAVWLGVFDPDMDVAELLITRQRQAIELATGALTIQQRFEIGAGYQAAEGQQMHIGLAIAPLLNADRAEMEGLRRFLLNLVVVQHRAITQPRFGYWPVQITPRALMLNNHGRLRIFL